jgi:streptomycin 3"-adenylyltransferase
VTQTDDVLRLVTGVLGDTVAGVYLHGSAVFGRLRPHSDLDLLVLTRRSATGPERRSLVDGLLATSGWGRRRTGDRPVELVLVVAGDVRPWRYPPVVDLLYGEWLRDGYLAGTVPSRAPAPDLAILLAQVRAADRALLGPSARELLDPVPPADVRAACLHGIPGLLADLVPDTANVVLTLARIWTTLATGEIVAKDAAADWALAHLPGEHRAVLRRARAVYRGEAGDRWDDLAPAVDAYADHVVAEIQLVAEIQRLPG